MWQHVNTVLEYLKKSSLFSSLSFRERLILLPCPSWGQYSNLGDKQASSKQKKCGHLYWHRWGDNDHFCLSSAICSPFLIKHRISWKHWSLWQIGHLSLKKEADYLPTEAFAVSNVSLTLPCFKQFAENIHNSGFFDIEHNYSWNFTRGF